MFSFSTRFHAFLDYFFSLFLMLAPAVFGFGEADMETIVPILAGMIICFYSFFSRYEGGLYPIFSMRIHYLFDFAMGIFVALSPWIFGFRDFVYKPHLFIGLAFTALTLLTVWPMVKLNRIRLHRTLTDAGYHPV